jgi:hypothetical protein
MGRDLPCHTFLSAYDHDPHGSSVRESMEWVTGLFTGRNLAKGGASVGHMDPEVLQAMFAEKCRTMAADEIWHAAEALYMELAQKGQ